MASLWIPQQHGAWAMLAAPATLGVVAAVRRGLDTGYLWWLVPAWFAAYAASWAASMWIKAAPPRRPQRRPPALVWALVAGLLAIPAVVAQPGLLWWAAVFGIGVGLSLVLVWMRQERSTTSGLLSAAGVSTFLAVCAAPDPRGLLAGDAPVVVAAVAVCFAYFGGTVFVVKSMIRHRGDVWWWVASVAWHAGATALAIAGTCLGWLPGAWVGFFAVAIARAAAWPWWARRGHTVRPMALGLIEVVFTVVLIGVAVTVGPLPGS